MTAERRAEVRVDVPLEDTENHGQPIQDNLKVLGKLLARLDSKEGDAVVFAIQRLGSMLFSVQCGQYVEEL